MSRDGPGRHRGPAIGRLGASLRRRNPLPPGTAVVAAGLVVNGVTTYGFLVLGRRALGEDSYSTLAVLWGLVFILGPGLFQPLEQEVARATADRASRGTGSAPVLRRAGILGVGQFAVAAGAVLVAWPLGLDGLLDNDTAVLAMLVFALGALGSAMLVRGVLSGKHRFAEYSQFLTMEGVGRLLVAGVIVIVGVETAGTFGLALAASFLLAAVVVVATHRPFVLEGPPAEWAELTPALGLLLATSLSEAFLTHVGPVAVEAISDVDGQAGVFLNAMIVARLPLFFFQAVKASLLPNLARLAGKGDHGGFRQVLERLLLFVVVLGSAGIVASAVIGPFVVELFFDDSIGRSDMAMLAAGNASAMVSLSLALALVALGRTRLAVFGWVSGVITFPLLLMIEGEVFRRVEIAFVGAMSVAAVAMALATAMAAADRR